MKTLMYCFSFFIFLTLAACSDCEKSTEAAGDQMAAIENVLEQYTMANENQDFAMIENIWAPDNDIILYGTNNEEKLMGWVNIKRAIKKQFSQISDTYISVSDQFIKINCAGNTAWFAEILNYNFMYEGEAHSFEGLRFTGVLELREGEWKMVQAHLSVPANIDLGKDSQ